MLKNTKLLMLYKYIVGIECIEVLSWLFCVFLVSGPKEQREPMAKSLDEIPNSNTS